MGVDVWGRNTRSGGGWNISQDLTVIQSKGLSCALFAPGWIFEHECNGQVNEEYFQKEKRFWHNTITEVTLDGSMKLLCDPSCVAYYVIT